MSLAAVKSQIGALGKRLDAMDGAGDPVHYLWTVRHINGEKEIMAGNRHSRAKQIVEICVDERDAFDAMPRVFINGERQALGATAPAITLEEVLIHDTDT